MKIRSKILVSIYSCSLVAFIGIGMSIYIIVSQYSLEQGYENLQVHHQLEKNTIENFLSEITEKLGEISQSEENRRSLPVLSKFQDNKENSRYQSALQEISENISHFQTIYPEIENILFVDTFGIIVYENNNRNVNGKFIDTFYGKGFLQRAKEQMFISDIRLRKEGTPEESYIFASIPMDNIGIIVIELGTRKLDILLQEYVHEQKRYLVGRDGLIKTNILGLKNLKFQAYNFSDAFHACFESSSNNVTGKRYHDFTGKEVLGNTSYISQIDMCLVSEVYVSRVLQTSRNILFILMVACSIMFFITAVIVQKFIKNITSPLIYLSEKISQLRDGNKEIDIQIHRKDEVGDLAKNFQEMVQDLHITDKKIQKRVDIQTEQIRQKQKETIKLNKELLKFQEALKKASDYIAILDYKGRVVYINTSLEKETGFYLEECRGEYTHKYWRKGEKDKKITETLATISQTHESVTEEMVTTRKDGTSFISDVHISPIINKKDEVEFYITIENDITQQKEVQKMKDEFISLVSHELRTPMTVIRGFTKLFLEEKFGTINPEQKKYLETISSNTEYLIHMVNDMLDIEKLNSGKMEFHYESCNIQEILHKLQESLSFMCKEKNICLSYSSKKCIIKSDKEKIEQVLINLIRNAYKFTSEYGEIHIYATQKKKNLYIEVTDTGIGIKKEDFGKIFQKFEQVESPLQNKQKGTGLGLSICKMIVENLGGEIGFTSTYGKGSTFFFTIPIQK